MNKKKINIVVIFSLLIFTNSTNLYAQTAKANKQIVNLIKTFYRSYLKQCSIEADIDKLGLIQKRFCTTNLLNKIDKQFKNDELDYDPFIKAQDCDPAWLKSLSVLKNPQKPYLYQVSYRDNFEKKYIVINLKVVKIKGSFKIDSVW